MALKTYESMGTGTQVSSTNEPSSYTQTITTKDGTVKAFTTFYTETRIETLFEALTQAAADSYIAANPTLICNAQLVNKATGAWNLSVVSLNRVITGYTITVIERPAPVE